MQGRPFTGQLLHLPGVSCDNFSGENRNNDQFFLSHCHTDHMIGLDVNFIKDMRRKNSVKVNHKIFCSPISKAFLINKFQPQFKDIKRFISDEIPITEGAPPVVVRVFDKKKSEFYKVNVTCVKAEHCPGSVMFLFEKEETGQKNKVILYTGDFRLEHIRLPTLKDLHTSAGEPLKIDIMYLDTTFCSKEYENFPIRDEAIQAIWDLVSSWIKKNDEKDSSEVLIQQGMYRKQRPPHVVLLKLPAQYGSEAVLKKIYQHSGKAHWKIHVSQGKQNDYLCTKDLSDFVDCQFENAPWIHACYFGNSTSDEQNYSHLRRLPCCAKDKLFTVRQIRPCAMYFNREQIEKGIISDQGGEFYRVCYSCHSSLTELKTFVQYFQPAEICPIVLPKDMSINDVKNLLQPVVHDSPKLKSDSESSLFDLGSPIKKQMSELVPPASPTLNSEQLTESPPTKMTKRKNFDFDGLVDSEDNMIKAKRRRFQWSRSSAVTCSMPVFHRVSQTNDNPRRASLPANIKIPGITITPSTPSPRHHQELEDPSFELHLSKDSWKTTLEGDDDVDMAETESRASTPELEEVFDNAKTEEDRRRIRNFEKKYENRI